jgi:8-amino-7-oxononanoate synthase
MAFAKLGEAMTPWASDLESDLRRLDELSLRRSIITPETGQEPHVFVQGRRYTLFTSNNYLGLSTHPEVIEASIEATRAYGTSVSSSRLLCGSTPLHEELEARLAALKSREACLLFSSGYLANLGLMTAFLDSGDVIFSDRLNHASIIDGSRLSAAKVALYDHCDLSHLEVLLGETPAKRRLIVSESVFSMDGDLAPVPELLELAERFGALLVLDEAHATGLLGEDGAGALSLFGIPDGPIVIVGTLSKALGSIGGFVAADQTLISVLLNRSRSFIFNTALHAGAVAAALASIRLLETEPWRRERSLSLAGTLREGIVQRGSPPSKSVTPIVPLMIGDAEAALALDLRLREAGVLARAIRPPTVPEGTSRIRFNVMATHEEEDISHVLGLLS